MTTLSRRSILKSGLASLAATGLISPPAEAAILPAIEAYRNPGCGCCEKWAEQMKQAGFSINMQDDPSLDDRRAKAGVPAGLAGCHTAFMGDYIIEGHVPPQDILSFLAVKSAARGLAVPGMPSGSPGMEAGGVADNFSTMIFYADGTSSVFANH